MSRDLVRHWRKTRPLTLFSLCFTFGVVVGYQNAVAWWLWLGGLLLSATVGLTRRRPVFAFSSAMLLGATLVSLALIRPAVSPMDDVRLTGTVADEARVYEDYVRFPLERAAADGEELPCRVMVYLYSQEPATLQCGDRISVPANLYLPSGQDNPLGFDYSAYLWREGIALCASASAKHLTVVDPPARSLKALSLRCRAAMQQMVRRIYPEESVPLISALLLGDRSMLPEDLVSQFNAAGVAHLLAISGLHISSMAYMLNFLLRKMRCTPRLSFALTTVLLVVYAWIVGYPPSVVRAALMYTLSAFARLSGRPSDGLSNLALALLILLLVNPLLIADASLILSFSSVGALITLTRLLLHKRRFYRPYWLCDAEYWLRSALAASLTAQLGALPAVACFYGQLATYSLLVNLPVIPLITLTLPVGMLSLAAGAILPSLGRLLALPVSGCLSALTRFSGWVASLPGAVVASPVWPTALILGYVLLLLSATALSGKSRRIRVVCLSVLPFLAACALLLPGMQPIPGAGNSEGAKNAEMEVLFLDVGQADAALLRAQDRYYLIDVGENGVVADYLRDTGIRPSGVFLSHPHADHAGGLTDLVALCPPATLYLPCLWDTVDADEGVREGVQAAREAGWRVQTLLAGDELSLSSDVCAHVLQPWPDMTDDANGASLTLHVRLGNGSALFTGDLPSEQELAFFPDCDLLKVAHHGSDGSTSRLFLQMTTPSAAVISVGHNAYGHPSAATLDRLSGIPTYRTDQCGAISALVRPDGSVSVTPMRTPTESEAAP